MVDAIHKRSIKGDKSHFFGVGECCQVCVSPQLRIWMRAIGQGAKSNFHIRWFVEKKHPVVMEPAIVCRPRFSLWQNRLPLDSLPLEGWIELEVLSEGELLFGA